MNAPDYRMQQEAEQERMAHELAILERIERGLTTTDDALYVAASFGLTNEFQQEKKHE